MKGKVYKFNLRPLSVINMVQGAQVLSVGIDAQGFPAMWVLEPSKAKGFQERVFVVIKTGTELSDCTKMRFIGTVQATNAEAHHVFEEIAR